MLLFVLVFLALRAAALSYQRHEVLAIGNALAVTGGAVAPFSGPAVFRGPNNTLVAGNYTLTGIVGWPRASVAWGAGAGVEFVFGHRGSVCCEAGCLRAKYIRRFDSTWLGLVPRKRRASVFG